jgi:hypothetical protein
MPTKVAKKQVKVVSAAPKKVSAAKKATKKASASCGACAGACRPEEAFWVNNGPVVDTLAGLQEALRLMTEEQYAYHTERAGNDFAVWVRDCLGDAATALRLAKAKNRDAAARVIVCVCK